MVSVKSPVTALPPRRILLSAFGIHMGGGLVLLNALTGCMVESLKEVLFDSRIEPEAGKAFFGGQVTYVRRSFLARLVSLFKLASHAAPQDVLFCFNSLPPLRKPKCRVINYVHAPHFAGAHRGIKYATLTTIRMAIERSWFRFGIRNCDEIWVQTESMADALNVSYPGSVVKVMPFVDDVLISALDKIQISLDSKLDDYSGLCFFYPADAVGHKNHDNLLQAWRILALAGKFPGLRLTLQPREFERVMAQAKVKQSSLKAVKNLGPLSRGAVFEEYSKCSALIFASKAETFGLPMLEATALGVPVIAAEKDFVRDVCMPIQTFDPASPRSIARAVERFATGDAPHEKIYLSAAQLIKNLLT